MHHQRFKKVRTSKGVLYFDPSLVSAVLVEGKGKEAKALIQITSKQYELDPAEVPENLDFHSIGEWVRGSGL